VINDGDYSKDKKGRQPQESLWPETKNEICRDRKFVHVNLCSNSEAPWYIEKRHQDKKFLKRCTQNAKANGKAKDEPDVDSLVAAMGAFTLGGEDDADGDESPVNKQSEARVAVKKPELLSGSCLCGACRYECDT